MHVQKKAGVNLNSGTLSLYDCILDHIAQFVLHIWYNNKAGKKLSFFFASGTFSIVIYEI